MSESKTYVFTPESGGMDATTAAILNGNGGFGGGMNNPFWAIILLAFLRNNFGWNGNGDTGYVSGQLSQAIAGNGNALSNLSTHLDCSIAQIQTAIAAVQQQMTNMGYENRLHNSEQTAILGGKIDQQTTLINDRFCQLEMREMQNKLDTERQKNLALTNQLSQEHQNGYFASMVAPLKSELDAIKCRLPETRVVPDAQGVYLTPLPGNNVWSEWSRC